MGLRKTLARYVDAVADYFLGHGADEVRPPAPDRTSLLAAVEDARREWLMARTYFDHVTDPRLVDYAIYCIGAAEKRYMYLLDEARRHGVEVEPRLHDGRDRSGLVRY